MNQPGFFRAVILGPAPPQPRPRATLMPVAKAPVILAAAHRAQKIRDLMGLFRPQIYSAASNAPIGRWKKRAAGVLIRARQDAGYPPRPIFAKGEPLEVLVLVVGELPVSKHRKTIPPPRAWQTSLRAGDFDNIAKPICDVATGILWVDDSQIARATVEKIVGAQGEEPRLEMIVRPLRDRPERTLFETERDALEEERTDDR